MELRPDNEGSDLVDPLAGYSPLSLFSRSLNLFSSRKNTTHLSNPNSSISDSLHANLKAKVLSSPDKLYKQASSILESSSDHLKVDKSEAVSTENEKVSRERRPGLGFEPAKFSMKPMPSQPAASLESIVDFSKLSDPDEYFDAFETMEKAKKEVQRLKGEPILDVYQNRKPWVPRPRRPSLSGRSATYIHRTYPSVSMADVDETLLPSQERFDNDILSPAHHDVVPDANAMNYSSSMRVSDSKATTTSKVSELDELLSLNYEGLDEDGVQNLILDKLQIKPIEFGKLPDWRAPLRESLTTSTALPKKNNTVFHLSGASKAVSSKDTKSPATSRSPLASISMLNRHIAKRNPPNDLFPSLRFDSSPEKATNPTRESEKRVDQAGPSDENDARTNMCDVRRSPVHGKEDTAVTSEDSLVSLAKDVNQISEPKEKEVVVGQFDQIGNQTELRKNGRSLVNGEENIAGSDVGPTSQPKNQNNEVAAAQESAQQQLIFEAQDMENSSLNEVENGGMDEPSNVENSFVEELTQETMGSSKRKLVEKGKSKAPSEAVVSEEPAKKGRQAKTSQSDVPVSKETRSKRRKVEGAEPRLSKGGRKFSLYFAGTKWDVGVRRSTRIRMRPMEFWTRERFLYGRVHESLPTVIGVKHASPSQKAEAGAKVKSFVSDEYKDLVDVVSLH